jgi:peptidoglycan hydrolase-like protein with peptidoglycan-binding domain
MSLQAALRRLVHATGALDMTLPCTTMFDDIVVAVLPSGTSYAYAGYVDGMWPTFPELKARFPLADLLDMTVFASGDATGLDIETGDATITQAPGWYERQVARGVYRPVLYVEASRMKALEEVMAGQHVARASYRLWTAHYAAKAHVCAPGSCGYGLTQADGTQWTQTAAGRNLDQSILLPGFFAPRPKPVPTPVPAVPAWEEAMMNALPSLSLGVSDDPGHVYFVHRMQALTALVGKLNGVAAASAVVADGIFDDRTHLGLMAVQKFFALTEDGVCGPKTWAALVTGHP